MKSATKHSALVFAVLASGFLLSSGVAHGQSGCGVAMADFQDALKANTAEALSSYIDQHAPCFEAPARARLQALGGAPKQDEPEAAASARYDGPEVSLTVLGSPSYLGEFATVAEKRFWTEAVPAIGNVSVDLQPDYGDFGSLEYARAIVEGKVDAALLRANTALTLEGPFGSFLAGLDVPLVAVDAATAHSVQQAVRDRVSDAMLEAGMVLLGAAPLLPGLMVCDDPVRNLNDLEGKSVRFYGKDRLIDALGGEAVSLGFSDIVPALERDVIDCVIIDAWAHYRLRTHRMRGHLSRATLLDGGVNALVMNAQAFHALPEEVRAGLMNAARTEFEDPTWNGVEAAIQADIECMTGKGSCPESVEPGNLTLAGPLPLDATAKRLLSEIVLPSWVESAPASLVDGWRADASTVIDIEAGH